MAKSTRPAEAEIEEQADAPAAPTEAEPERATMAELSGIRFASGQVDSRIITAANLKELGVEPKSDDDLVWSLDNGFVLPIDAVNAATVDALIELPGFSAV